MSRLKFDAESHTYWLDGARIPSVTQVLKVLTGDQFASVPKDVLANAVALGTAVHCAIELDIDKELDDASLHDTVRPYLDMWRNWCAVTGFEPDLSEQQVYSRRLRFAGTVDVIGRFKNGDKAIIDIKRCALMPPSVGPQTAGYALAYSESFDCDKPHRFALQFPKNAKHPKLEQFQGFSDERSFLAALTVYQWKERNHD